MLYVPRQITYSYCMELKLKKSTIKEALTAGIKRYRYELPVSVHRTLDGVLAHITDCELNEIDLFEVMVWAILLKNKEELVHVADLMAQLQRLDYADPDTAGSLAAMLRDGLMAEQIFKDLENASPKETARDHNPRE